MLAPFSLAMSEALISEVSSQPLWCHAMWMMGNAHGGWPGPQRGSYRSQRWSHRRPVPRMLQKQALWRGIAVYGGEESIVQDSTRRYYLLANHFQAGTHLGQVRFHSFLRIAGGDHSRKERVEPRPAERHESVYGRHILESVMRNHLRLLGRCPIMLPCSVAEQTS